MVDNAKIIISERANRTNGARAAGQKPRARGGGYPRARRPTRGSRPARTATEGWRSPTSGTNDAASGHPRAGCPTYGNSLPLRGLGIDRPAMIGDAIARERDVGGRLPSGRMSPAGTGKMAGYAAGVGKRGCRRGKAIGLEWDDYREGRRPSRSSIR